MSDRAFLDTNVLIYFYSENEANKRVAAYDLLNSHNCVTSIHAMNETSNVWLKKFKWSSAKVKEHMDNIELVCDEILPIQRNVIDTAIDIKERYGYSYYDSLMLSSALEGGCDAIFTEDMSDGQIINGRLKIVNPFSAL